MKRTYGDAIKTSDLAADPMAMLDLDRRYICEWMSEDRQASLWVGEGDTPDEAAEMGERILRQDHPDEAMTGTLILHELM